MVYGLEEPKPVPNRVPRVNFLLFVGPLQSLPRRCGARAGPIQHGRPSSRKLLPVENREFGVNFSGSGQFCLARVFCFVPVECPYAGRTSQEGRDCHCVGLRLQGVLCVQLGFVGCGIQKTVSNDESAIPTSSLIEVAKDVHIERLNLKEDALETF